MPELSPLAKRMFEVMPLRRSRSIARLAHEAGVPSSRAGAAGRELVESGVAMEDGRHCLRRAPNELAQIQRALERMGLGPGGPG